jgi:hypothetical protein
MPQVKVCLDCGRLVRLIRAYGERECGIAVSDRVAYLCSVIWNEPLLLTHEVNALADRLDLIRKMSEDKNTPDDNELLFGFEKFALELLAGRIPMNTFLRLQLNAHEIDTEAPTYTARRKHPRS